MKRKSAGRICYREDDDPDILDLDILLREAEQYEQRYKGQINLI